MKYLIALVFLLSLFLLSFLFFSLKSCVKDTANTKMLSSQNKQHKNREFGKSDIKENKLKIIVGYTVFSATLYKNQAASAFKELLPLTLDMEDYNGNEKKYDFLKGLPRDSHNPKIINAGDLMIWNGNTLVIFYKSFPTSYSYTRLGIIDNPSGIEKALGTGNIKIKFELDQDPY